MFGNTRYLAETAVDKKGMANGTRSLQSQKCSNASAENEIVQEHVDLTCVLYWNLCCDDRVHKDRQVNVKGPSMYSRYCAVAARAEQDFGQCLPLSRDESAMISHHAQQAERALLRLVRLELQSLQPCARGDIGGGDVTADGHHKRGFSKAVLFVLTHDVLVCDPAAC